MRGLIGFLLLSNYALAFQLPWSFPFLHSNINDRVLELVVAKPPKIAVIGAGAAGSSAAFWIAKAKERYGVDVDVDVYDREDYIGGRSTVVYPYNDTTLGSFELGASIFVKANKNLWRASDEFNLTREDFSDTDEETGIWDGEKFIVTLGGASFFSMWLDSIKVLLRYGYKTPLQARSIISATVRQFVELYKPDSPKWENISSLAAEFKWDGLTAQTTAEYLESHGVSQKFTREFVESATRVNYGQNVDEIHALEGICSLAATGASSIQGGNFQIFEHFLNKSGAQVYLGTNVKNIARPLTSSSSWSVTSDKGTTQYKAVILAAPFHSTGISLSDSLALQIPKQPYVHLHVTLLTTTTPHPNPEYFSLSSSSRTPTTILTTYEGARQGGTEPEFNSLSYHGLVHSGEDAAPEWKVKIFSKQRVSDEWLAKIFQNQVGWVYRKEWDAYPQLPPTTTFPPIKLEDGLYYVNAFEPFISTMETETIASRNVVDLLLHEHFESGICGPRLAANMPVEASDQEVILAPTHFGEEFVWGWDC